MSGNREIICEDGFSGCAKYVNLEEARKAFSERTTAVVSKSSVPKNCLKIRQMVGYADEPTSNENIYLTADLKEAFGKREADFKAGRVWGTFGEHPKDRAFINPDEVSHIITKAWVDESKKVQTKNGEMAPSIWNESIIVPTTKGKDYQALVLSGASIGNSIRGTAVRNEKNHMKSYNYEGFDCVGMPSTGVYAGLENEEYPAELLVESFEEVLENETLGEFTSFLVYNEGDSMGKDDGTPDEATSLSTDLRSISESLKSLSSGKTSASDLVELGLKIGTLEQRIESIQKSNQAKDGELGGLTERFEELKELKDVLEAEKDEKVQELDTFKATIADLKTQVEGLETDLSVKEGTCTKSVQVIEELRTRYNDMKTVIEGDDSEVLVSTIEEMRDLVWKHEKLSQYATDYILRLESGVAQVRDYALKLEKFAQHMAETHTIKTEQMEVACEVADSLRDLANGVNKITPKSTGMGNYIEHLMDKHPKLKHFREELHECSSLKMVQVRVGKYLDLIDKSGRAAFEADTCDDEKPVRTGIERMMGGGLQ